MRTPKTGGGTKDRALSNLKEAIRLFLEEADRWLIPSYRAIMGLTVRATEGMLWQ